MKAFIRIKFSYLIGYTRSGTNVAKKYVNINMEQQNQQQQGGTGGAENTGNDRNDQQNKSTDLSNTEKESVANEIGESSDSVTTIRDLGQLSGRDDASGGTGDQMENQNTGQNTEKF